ncbi:phage tail protein [Marinobacter sp. 1Y8]
MGWLDDTVDSITDAVSDVFSGDIFGGIENAFNGIFDVITLGTFSYVKDQVRGLFDYPSIPSQDRKRMVKAPTGARQVVYGRCRTGGQLAYIESWYDDKRFLTMTLVVAAHQVEEITAVFAGGRKVAGKRASGNGIMPVVQDGKYNRPGEESRIFCWSVKGDQTNWVPGTVTPSGVPTNPPGWTPAHKLLGQAYVHVFFWYDQDVFDSGLPSIEVELKGKNDIYDPRTGLTGYTDNQALVTLDVLRWPRLFHMTDSEIDMPAFIQAANIADQLVASGPGTTERRYTVNGAFKMETPPLEVLRSVADAGAAYPFYTQGEWTIAPGAYSAPVMTLDESDLVGGIKFQPGPGKSARHNKASGTYVDASQNFESVEFTHLNIAAYVADDLEELEKPFDFPWTISGSMARRLAKIEIERGRFGLSATITAKFKALRLTPGDRVNLNIAALGWTPKTFRVESSKLDFDAGVRLSLREDSPAIYSWEEGDALALDAPPPINLPEGLEISPPQNIAFTEELYRTLTRNAVKVRLSIQWDADEVANAYDIQYKLSGDSVWEPAATFWQDNDIQINDVLDADYDVRIRSINILGRRSDWVTLSYTVIGKSAPPPDISLLFVEGGTLRWQYPDAPVDLAGFLVRFQNGDRRLWADATPMHENIVTETVFDVSRYSGTKTFLVKAVDTTGNESENAVVLVQGLGDARVANVIYTQSEAGLDWPGTVTGGFVNGTDELEAAEVGAFWGAPDSIFWPQDPATPFYSNEYKKLEYEFTVTVSAQDAGSNLTAAYILDGAVNDRLDYKPPGYIGSYLAFPGAIDAVEGTYTFRLVIPNQFTGTAPTVTDITVSLDVEDIEESLNDITLISGGTRLPITRTYRAITNVSLTLQSDGGAAESVKIIDKNSIGPLIQGFDSAGAGTAATIDATIQGY